MRPATSWASGIASGSTPPASEHAPSVPASARGSNSFLMWGNMALLSATGNCRDVSVGPERVALVHAAGIPEHPRPDAQLFGCANLLADFVRRVARLAAAERERLEVRTDRRRFGERPRALDRLAQRVADYSIRLAVGPGEPVAAAIVMARVHHRQHDVGDGDEIL